MGPPEGPYEEYAVCAVFAAIDAEELALEATGPRSVPGHVGRRSGERAGR